MNENNSPAKASDRSQHKVHHWSGSPFEIGLRHGRALCAQIRSEYEPALREFAQCCRQSEGQVLDGLVRHLEPIFQQYVPHAVEEIQGLAQGSELSFPQAFFAATRDGLAFPSQNDIALDDGECTAVVCGKGTTQNGEVLIGQTKDTCAPLERYHIMRLDYSDGRRSIVLNYPGWCANIGLTSHGLCFTGNS
ncbi:MAG: C45 family autoproteolytic acyltransferase/hydrolase, partial [Abditibacteriaceae bacterium]